LAHDINGGRDARPSFEGNGALPDQHANAADGVRAIVFSLGQ
jgi:hypothetical protein